MDFKLNVNGTIAADNGYGVEAAAATAFDDINYATNFLAYIGFASQIPNVIFNWLNIFINMGYVFVDLSVLLHSLCELKSSALVIIFILLLNALLRLSLRTDKSVVLLFMESCFLKFLLPKEIFPLKKHY